MQIDAHQHFWRLERGDYGWLTPAHGPLHRDYGPEDLAPHLAAHGVDATVLVQAAPTEAETRFLLEIAARTPFVAGVVGWTDLAAADASARIERLAADDRLVGLRPMVQDLDDDDWLLRRDLRPGVEAMVRHGLVFDALVHPRHLPRLAAFLDRYPNLPVVLDHGGKPPIGAGSLDPWRADLAAVAARPRTVCKASGLVTEAGSEWTLDQLRPVVDHLVACFGPDRLLWGSDWPVCALAGGYGPWRRAAEALLASLGPAVFGSNAARVYLRRRTGAHPLLGQGAHDPQEV